MTLHDQLYWSLGALYSILSLYRLYFKTKSRIIPTISNTIFLLGQCIIFSQVYDMKHIFVTIAYLCDLIGDIFSVIKDLQRDVLSNFIHREIKPFIANTSVTALFFLIGHILKIYCMASLVTVYGTDSVIFIVPYLLAGLVMTMMGFEQKPMWLISFISLYFTVLVIEAFYGFNLIHDTPNMIVGQVMFLFSDICLVLWHSCSPNQEWIM
jgi:hypothetical protein